MQGTAIRNFALPLRRLQTQLGPAGATPQSGRLQCQPGAQRPLGACRRKASCYSYWARSPSLLSASVAWPNDMSANCLDEGATRMTAHRVGSYFFACRSFIFADVLFSGDPNGVEGFHHGLPPLAAKSAASSGCGSRWGRFNDFMAEVRRDTPRRGCVSRPAAPGAVAEDPEHRTGEQQHGPEFGIASRPWS